MGNTKAPEKLFRTGVVLVLALAAVWLAYLTVAGGESIAAAEPATAWGDAGRQRQELLEAQQQTNRKLDEIIGLLTSGKVRVQVTGDETGGSHEATTKPDGS